ncbi:hypothetical protein ACK1JC_03975 [Acinetobacter sp. TY2]|uniref:hypothetical protein n=1 Tax=Acinetobacter sp. TY2 TaxID=3387403 RepID=UPI003917B012
MDIQKEKTLFFAFLESEFPLTVADLKSQGVDPLDHFNTEWDTWQAAKTQAVPEWIDYTKQSPRIDGRYQIFISGEQLTANWELPYGFTCPQDGCAFIQEIISHWAVLNPVPVIEAQEQAQ